MPSKISAVIVAATVVWAPVPAFAAPLATTIQLTPHRAVYDLKLARTRGSRSLEDVRGRILYDFSGSSCAGYELQFRQVSELDSGEGKSVLSDLRSNTWEDAAAKSFRFNSENRMNNRTVDAVDGDATRKSGDTAINLHKPSDKKFSISAEAVFPTEHMRRIIAAARSGQSLLELQVYDGSETGEKIYNTLTVIGKPIPPGEKPPQEAAANLPELATLQRWPVTISYFERNAKSDQSSEQQPVYAIGFELYDNGISRALRLDYTDFTISGEMTSLEMKKPKPCP
ncbi:MAG: cell envelope integrity EipB family protein [Pseudolabrys sp.]